jgi:uncharacterized membrane protein
MEDGIAILVMLNSYFHDLATAIFAVSAVAAWLLLRSRAMERAPDAVRPVVEGLVKLGVASLVWTLLAGMIRGLTYYDYEYAVAYGRGQVPVLILKHVILVTLVSLGVWVLIRVRRLLKASAHPAPGSA